jgi:hypothetical protein
VQLCTCALPVTPENTIPNITLCEGLLPSEYPHLNISQSTKIVYVVRNPKDIAGTLYRNSDDYDDTYLSDYLIRFINGLPGMCLFISQFLAYLTGLFPFVLQMLEISFGVGVPDELRAIQWCHFSAFYE